jgi:3-oxoacyl-[acyl-carrier protein] reductase
VPADVTSEEQVERAVHAIRKVDGSLRGTVNSAAISQSRRFQWPLGEESSESWRQILWTNVLGSWLVTKSALPLMVQGGAIRVVFLSSEAGWASTVGFGQYNVSKAALNSLAVSMAEECSVRYACVDVQMNVVVPGEARTEMNQSSDSSPYALASIVLLLLSHKNDGPNGKFFHRDGRHLEFAYSTIYERSISDS